MGGEGCGVGGGVGMGVKGGRWEMGGGGWGLAVGGGGWRVGVGEWRWGNGGWREGGQAVKNVTWPGGAECPARWPGVGGCRTWRAGWPGPWPACPS